MTDPDPLDEFRRQQERLDQLIQSSTLRSIREHQVRLTALTEPAVKRMLDQQRRLAEWLQPRVLRMVEQQQRLAEAMQPAITRTVEQQRQLAELMQPSVIQTLEQQRRLAELVQPSVQRIVENQRQLERLLRPAWADAQARLAPFADGAALEAFLDYQQTLASRMVEFAEADALEVDTDEAIDPDVWFGARSWAYLLWEIEGLLKTLELLTAGLGAARLTLNAPISEAYLAVIVMLIVAGELALYFAKGGPEDGPPSP